MELPSKSNPYRRRGKAGTSSGKEGMMFITKRKLNGLLKEERRKYVSLGFNCGYKTCQSDNGSRGFITGLQQAERILRDKEASYE